MTAIPAPLEWHPAYRDQTWLLAWVEGRDANYPARMRIPITPVIRLTYSDEPDTRIDPIRSHTLDRRRARGAAPYIGRPFIYRWCYATDELGRAIAGEAEIIYASDDFTFCDGPFEYAHEARNGHDPDTPVWP